MKTVSKIDPELEYENACKIIHSASDGALSENNWHSLEHSVDQIITATRILMEREDRRRGPPTPPDKTLKKKGGKEGKEKKEAPKLPSQRYPNLEVQEEIISLKSLPICECCNETMKPSDMFSTSEKLEVIPKKYYIVRKKRIIYKCGHCHTGLVTAPQVPSIVPQSNYGDSIILDVAISKYCDLVPIERYATIAQRYGLIDLPPQSLIEGTHHAANFFMRIYDKIKNEVQFSKIAYADETPHNMLEGDDKSNWFLWGFMSQHACYYEIHNTRSGDVVKAFLLGSQTEYLLTDGYTGYAKARRLIYEESGRVIHEVFCNAHAVRYFKDASVNWVKDTKIILETYREIYDFEALKKLNPENKEMQRHYREQMAPLFEKIKNECQQLIKTSMKHSSLEKAAAYFLNHYEGLIVCTKNIDLELDNNIIERSFRPNVVGKKAWLGTHSKRGALTHAVLYTIIETCKLNKINPRNYFEWIVNQIHQDKEILTPYEYSLQGTQ